MTRESTVDGYRTLNKMLKRSCLELNKIIKQENRIKQIWSKF